MDFSLRCNALKCRASLTEQAVVTTCSHIFCIRCSDALHLSNPAGPSRQCPACKTPLMNPDDAVVAHLNPTEDYKTSVLSGLSPSIIMECAGRGLAFYSYQATQEIMYQEHLVHSHGEKYGTLSSQLDKIIHDANTEIVNLRDKLQALQNVNAGLLTKNQELFEAHKAKAATLRTTTHLYNKLKSQALHGQMATAASQNTEAMLQNVRGARYVDQPVAFGGSIRSREAQFHVGAQPNEAHSRHQSGASGGVEQNSPTYGYSNPTPWKENIPGAVGSTCGARMGPMGTPLHRQQLPMPTSRGGKFMNTNSLPFGPEVSARKAGANAGGLTGISGYGLSGNMRVGRQV